MGTLTATNLFLHAGLSAGDESVDQTRQLMALNAWLRATYLSWPWPFLHRRSSAITLAAGATSVSFGAGSTETLEVSHVYSPIYIGDSNYQTKVQADITPLVSGSAAFDESLNNPSTNTGVPNKFKLRPDATTWGKWSLIPQTIPSQDLRIFLDYTIVPAALATASETPLFPDDRTLLKACEVFILEWNENERAPAERGVLSEMLSANRMRFGGTTGINDEYVLDKGVFR